VRLRKRTSLLLVYENQVSNIGNEYVMHCRPDVHIASVTQETRLWLTDGAMLYVKLNLDKLDWSDYTIGHRHCCVG